MRRRKLQSIFIIIFFIIFAGCSFKGSVNKSLILATTTSTQDTGLLDVLLPPFEKKNNIKIKLIAVGTGEAIKLGERGEADVLLVHSKEAEEKFVNDGYGVDRKKVMHNDFVIVGSLSDKAGIKDSDNPVEAFKKVAKAKAVFVSRGDDSGTHKKEKKIWEKAGLIPDGNWYIESGQGMAETLRIVNEKDGYTLSDRATFLTQKKNLDIAVLFENDKDLLNFYSVMAINPNKFPKANYKDAKKFINFITSLKGQKIIGNFKRKKFGRQIFIPDAITNK